MKNNKQKYLIIIVLLIAAFLRLWRLGTNPPSLTPDEAALGYNAYSILKTGRDEYGAVLPIIFKSFGDYKPGLYIYTTVPSVAIFGLNEWSVRLPSAIAGIVAIWLIYKIINIQLVFKDKKSTFNYEILAIVASLALAISPWHIHFSRGAWEINLSLTLTLAGIYFFQKSLVKSKYLVYSALFFALTLITYQGAKLSTLIVLVLLTLVNWQEVKKMIVDSPRKVAFSAIIGLVITLPIIMSFFRGETGRLKVFSIFSYKRPQEYLELQLQLGEVKFGSPKYYLFYSEKLNTVRGIMGRWFNHFSGRFLFFDGDWQNPRHSAPDSGEMLLADMIFLVVGLAYISKTKNKFSAFFLGWLVLAPFSAALSRDEVHAVRAYNMVIPLTVIASCGVVGLIGAINKYKKPMFRVTYYLLIIGLYTGSMIYFLDNYFVHQPVHNSQYWEYGYKQVVEDVTPIQNNYKIVHVRQSYAQPYIYFLFYQQYDPAKYQTKAHLIDSEYGDVGRVEELDNIRFWPIDWTVNRGDFGTLFVADPIRIPPEDSNDPKEFRVIDEIKYLDGKETAFRLVEVKDKNE